MAADLSTTYLGLRLANPFMPGASPLTGHLDTIRQLEDAGCAAIVLHSLFEEQITEAETGRIHQMDPSDTQFATVLSYFPDPTFYALGPDEYLEHVRRAKEAVAVPVIASLNGTTPSVWLEFARLIEQAGADALELNMYQVVSETNQPGTAIESNLRRVVQDLKHDLTIPIAVKLSPFFTALANVAHDLQHAGANGLVLFNRFLQPDIDVEHLTVAPRFDLSNNSELLLRLRWVALLRGDIHGSLAVTGGVSSPTDGIKAILAGADAVQMVSAILRSGPSYFALMCDELARWMESIGCERMGDVRGRLSLERTEAPSAFERAQYIRAVSRAPSVVNS